VFGTRTSSALRTQLVLERLWLAAGPTAGHAFCKLRKVRPFFLRGKQKPQEAPGGPAVASPGRAYAGTLCLRTPIQNFARSYRQSRASCDVRCAQAVAERWGTVVVKQSRSADFAESSGFSRFVRPDMLRLGLLSIRAVRQMRSRHSSPVRTAALSPAQAVSSSSTDRVADPCRRFSRSESDRTQRP
jgi:hypothetical protein